MKRIGHVQLFNLIAPIYGKFFNWQTKQFSLTITKLKPELDLSLFDSIVDIGCGTGAFCAALSRAGLQVTGVDPAEKMLAIARKRVNHPSVQFLQGNVLDGLPMKDNTFDVAVASYVAHGLQPDERKKMYREMARIARHYVVIHDYNQKRSPIVTFVEWLEGGDYFHFIRHAEPEMKKCVDEMMTCFSEVRVVHAGKRANWYIGKPRQKD